MEITENGIVYIVTGDYPDGRFVKQIKNKGATPKSIYTRADFIAVIPKTKVREIQTAKETNDDINVWVFNLPMVDRIDLNNLPAWFTDGIAAMVSEGIFSQGQVNNFLEL